MNKLKLRIRVWMREQWVGFCRFLLAVMDFDLREWLEEQANSDGVVDDRYSRLY
jgi:hypothetical protein